jgi:uncharacterized membrane protein
MATCSRINFVEGCLPFSEANKFRVFRKRNWRPLFLCILITSIILICSCGKLWVGITYPSQPFQGYVVSSWLFIDGGGVDGININPANTAFTLNLNGLNGVLYGTWQESASGSTNPYETRAALYNGNSSWSYIDGGTSAVGLNYNSADLASNPYSTVSNHQLYAAWHEQEAVNTIRAIVYNNNGSSWSFIDGGTATGLNFNAARGGDDVHLVDFNGQLCATWTETSTSNFVIRVKCYNGGSSWSFIDGGTTLGLNQNQANGGVTQTRVAQYNGGNSWTFIDGGTANGINNNPAFNATTPKLVSCQGHLFGFWTEDNGSATQVRIAQYGGGSNWSFIDGGGSAGLNHNPSEAAQSIKPICYGAYLYITWIESNGVANQIRASVYDGTRWTSVDGNGVNGLNNNISHSGSDPTFGILNNVIYLGWSESVGGFKNIRVSVGH